MLIHDHCHNKWNNFSLVLMSAWKTASDPHEIIIIRKLNNSICLVQYFCILNSPKNLACPYPQARRLRHDFLRRLFPLPPFTKYNFPVASWEASNISRLIHPVYSVQDTISLFDSHTTCVLREIQMEISPSILFNQQVEESVMSSGVNKKLVLILNKIGGY